MQLKTESGPSSFVPSNIPAMSEKIAFVGVGRMGANLAELTFKGRRA